MGRRSTRVDPGRGRLSQPPDGRGALIVTSARAEYRIVEPPHRVEVLHEGIWYDGQLSRWVRDAYGWQAFVRWHVAAGSNYLGLVAVERVRPFMTGE